MKEIKECFELPYEKLVSSEIINKIVYRLVENKDKFLDKNYGAEEWDVYVFPGNFIASLPKKGTSAEEVGDADIKFRQEIAKGFRRAQADAMYYDELDLFYEKFTI